MKKETVIRQNQCDREMNFLFFCCYIIFMAIQLFGGATRHPALVSSMNLLLYMVFVPGFLFRLGYGFGRTRRTESFEDGRKLVFLTGVQYYCYYVVYAMGQLLFQQRLSFLESLNTVLTVTDIPAVGAVFFAMALAMFLAGVFYEGICRLIQRGWRWVLALGIVCLLTSFLRVKGETYALFASFIGSDAQQAVPLLPYFSFFLLGIWADEKKPALQWRLLGISAAVTAVSLLLYRTPLQNLCRVTASFLLVYMVYVVSEYFTDVTLRLKAVQVGLQLTEPVVLVYSMVLFLLARQNMLSGIGIKKLLLLAGGLFAGLYLGIGLIWVVSRIYGAVSDWFTHRAKHRTAAYFGIYTLLFAGLLVFVFFDFLYLGKSFVWAGDGLTQYFPRALYFGRYIRELLGNFLHGDFTLPMYDFTNGFGGEIVYSMEPLYFLFALFGENHVELAYNVIMLLRFYLTGITSSILFLYFGKQYDAAFLGSIVYTFCGFALYGGAKHPMFMIPMIMLPLLIIAIEEIIRGRRWYLCTILVAVSLFSNYYYLYMNTIGMGIYFLVRFFCQKEKQSRSFANFMKKGLTICGSYLLGVAMSCVILVSNFAMYVGSGRSGEITINTSSLFYYSKEWLVRCFLSFITTANSPGDWLKLGYLPIAFLAVVFLFLRRGRKELKIFAVIAAVMMALPLSGFVFSGFSAIVNRWCYMISLLVGFILADCLPEMRRLKRRDVLVLGASVGVYGLLAFTGTVLSTQYTKMGTIWLAVTLAVVVLSQQTNAQLTRPVKQSMMLLLTAVLLLYQSHSEFVMNGEIGKYQKAGTTYGTVTGTPLAALQEVDDDSFYRGSVTRLAYLTSSASLILGFNGITTVCSTLNSNTMEYLEKMGATSYSLTQLMGLSNRTFLSALASVKYSACYEEDAARLMYGYEDMLHTTVNGDAVTVAENQYALPLGYTYKGAISEKELEAYEPQQRQEVMLQKVVLEDAAMEMEAVKEASPDSSEEGDITITGQQVPVTSVKENGISLTEHGLTAEKAGGSVTLKFDAPADSEVYIVLKNAVYEGDGTENTMNFTFKVGDYKSGYNFHSVDDRYGTGQDNFVFNLGYYEEEIHSCKIRMNRVGSVTFDSMEVYAQPMDKLPSYSEALTEDILENVTLDTNSVSGTISLEEDKILTLSIPYQKGWTALVDGEETELLRANYMYMALPLTAGDHTIQLNYAIPGVNYALMIMAAALAVFVLLCIITWIAGKHKKRSFRKK